MPRHAQRERKRGLAETVVHIYNPLPETEDAELLERAGLTLTTPATRPPFRMTWVYGAAKDREVVRLDPGERKLLRESEAKEFMETFREQGAVILALDADAHELATASAEGLRRALKFYRDRGAVRVKDYQKAHGLDKEEMEDRRYDIWAWHHNQAKADVIEDSLRKLRGATTNPAMAEAAATA